MFYDPDLMPYAAYAVNDAFSLLHSGSTFRSNPEENVKIDSRLFAEIQLHCVALLKICSKSPPLLCRSVHRSLWLIQEVFLGQCKQMVN